MSESSFFIETVYNENEDAVATYTLYKRDEDRILGIAYCIPFLETAQWLKKACEWLESAENFRLSLPDHNPIVNNTSIKNKEKKPKRSKKDKGLYD